MLLTLLSPLLLAQAIGSGNGPSVTPGRGPAVAENPLREAGAKRRRGAAASPADLPTTSRLRQCLAQTDTDAEGAEITATAWLKSTSGSASAEPQLCLGVAQGAQGQWDEAEASFMAGRDIAAASEAIAFAARQGLDIRKVYEVITASAGNSWMFENRMPHVLDGDYTPRSAVEIFVKDLGIIQDMARTARLVPGVY